MPTEYCNTPVTVVTAFISIEKILKLYLLTITYTITVHFLILKNLNANNIIYTVNIKTKSKRGYLLDLAYFLDVFT